MRVVKIIPQRYNLGNTNRKNPLAFFSSRTLKTVGATIIVKNNILPNNEANKNFVINRLIVLLKKKSIIYSYFEILIYIDIYGN